MSPQSGGHKSDQLEPAGSPEESPRRLTEVPSIATPNRFALLEATSNADEALVSLPKKDKLDLEAKGTTDDGAPMSCNTIRSVQAPASSGSESQPARRQTESSCEGMQLHPEQRPVISRASTSHALVGSTSEPSNSRKSMESTAKAQSEGQTHLGQTRAPDRAQGQDLVAVTEQPRSEPAHVQAWRAAGYPDCNTCGKRHPPPCKPELVAESRQRAQKKQQRKEERRQQIAEEQRERQNKKQRREGEAHLAMLGVAPSRPPPPPPPVPQLLQGAIGQRQWEEALALFRFPPRNLDRSKEIMRTLFENMSDEIKAKSFMIIKELKPTLFEDMSEESKYETFMSMLGYQVMPSTFSQQSWTQTLAEATRDSTVNPSESTTALVITGDSAVSTGTSTGSLLNQQVEASGSRSTNALLDHQIATRGTTSAHIPHGQRPPRSDKGKHPRQ